MVEGCFDHLWFTNCYLRYLLHLVGKERSNLLSVCIWRFVIKRCSKQLFKFEKHGDQRTRSNMLPIKSPLLLQSMPIFSSTLESTAFMKERQREIGNSVRLWCESWMPQILRSSCYPVFSLPPLSLALLFPCLTQSCPHYLRQEGINNKSFSKLECLLISNSCKGMNLADDDKLLWTTSWPFSPAHPSWKRHI